MTEPTTCPTCGSPVAVLTADEGTVPVDVDELEALLEALVYFAPQSAVDPFRRAVMRAATVLEERGATASPNDLRQWVDRWPPVR
jgi:hypothetical protein